MHVGGGDLIAFLDHELGLTCSDLRPGRQTTAAPFVLLVQEVFRRSDRLPVVESSGRVPWTIDPQPRPDEALDIVEIAGLCGLSLVYVPSARNGPDTGSRPGEDKGNAILSNLDLADPFAIDLPFEAGRRVAVGADVVAAGGVVRVVSAHLDVASTLFRTLMTGNQTRARQAAGLIEGIDLLEDRRPDLSATVVGVDLNTWAPNETAVLLMRTAFPESPAWDGRNTRGPFPTDHLFVRSAEDGPRASQHRIIENSHRSDHKGRVLFLHR
jgi:endonuclease/exonuclease/phosphatase family metal-dependent hydrolase